MNLFNKNLLLSNELWYKFLSYLSEHLLINDNEDNKNRKKSHPKNLSQYITKAQGLFKSVLPIQFLSLGRLEH